MARINTVPGAGVAKKESVDPKRLYVFIDDSNIFIEGQRTAAYRDPTDASARHRFRIDFGRLLTWIADNRTLADVYLVGSRPPEIDSLWKLLPQRGIRPKIFDRQRGREKGVDHDLVAEMIEASIREKKEGGVMILVAGDGDYRSTLDRLVAKGWKVEVYFWSSGCSQLIKNTPWYINLDPHFKEFCFSERPR